MKDGCMAQSVEPKTKKSKSLRETVTNGLMTITSVLGGALGCFLTAVSVAFLLWVLVSFVDVNLHNGIDRYGNPQGGTQWENNFFVILIELLPSE